MDELESKIKEIDLEQKKSSLDRLSEKLYTKGAILPKIKWFRLRKREESPAETWVKGEDESPQSLYEKESKRMSFIKKFFVSSLIFLIGAAGIFVLVFITGGKTASPKKVDILVSGPVSVEAGKKISLQIIVENKNNLPLEATNLIVEYPEGSRDVEDIEEELLRVQRTLSDVEANGLLNTTEEAILFGYEGEEKKIRVTFEYRIQDSNAIYETTKEYSVFISSSPITLTVQTLEEVNSGKEFEMEITISSNSNQVLKDLMLHVEYPFGYSLLSATPEPAYGKDTWILGDLPQGGERSVVLKGFIEGQNEEEKVFRIESGVAKSDDERTIGIVYTSSIEGVRIARPFLDTELSFEGQRVKEFVTQSRESVSIELSWKNNLPTKVVDMHIEARLKGAALDRRTVLASKGFYRSFDDTIIWDSGTLSDLLTVESGSSGHVAFRIASNSLLADDGRVLKNPQIEIEVDIKAKRLSGGGVPEEIEVSARGVIKFESDTTLAQRSVYFIGPFSNSGPIPPQVDKETLYTIIWTVTNTANPLSGGVVTATLPPYVRWVGSRSPQNEEIVFIEESRTVRWALGNIKEGAGITGSPREVSFQVGILPSLSQLGRVPVLSPDIGLTAHDEFTDTDITALGKVVTTNLTTDPQFEKGTGNVVE